MKPTNLDDMLAEELEKQTALPPVQPEDYDLYNPASSNYSCKRQRPEHLLMVMLKVQGLSYREIAERVGFSSTAVQGILKLPWARQQIVFEMKKAGRNAVESILESEVSESIHTMVEIRDDKGNKPSDRRAAAEYLINRRLGMPKTAVEHSGSVKLDSLSDEELIRRLPEDERRQFEELGSAVEVKVLDTDRN